MPQPIAPLSADVSPDIASLLNEAVDCAALSDGLIVAERAFALAQKRTSLDRASAAHVTCFFLYRTGATERVMTFGEAMLPLVKLEAMPAAYAEMLRWIGVCACDSGLFGVAIKHATEGYHLADQMNDQRGRVLAFSLLGGCFERSGDPWQGERLLRDGLALARQFGEPYPLITTLNNLAAVLIGKFYSLREGWAATEGRAALADCLPLAREVLQMSPIIGDPYLDAFAHGNLGEVLVHLGQLSEAETLLHAALALAESGGYHAVSPRVRCSIGELKLARGDFRTARIELTALLAEQKHLPTISTQMRVHYALYLAHRGEGDTTAALAQLEAFRRIESQRSMQQLKAKSEHMVMRLEADETQRKGLEKAYGVAQAHASRASELERITLEDELTGLGNRRALDLKLAGMVANARTTDAPLVVVLLDLDHFKQINDRFGHTVGDRVLVQVARLLSEHTRASDMVVRSGGEEFVLVMPGTSAPDAFDICERLRQRVSGYPWATIAPELHVAVSAGIASAPDYDAATLVERADLAMYRAKRAGRNRVAVAA
ncbi:MAG: GGDEF domain-containing protein [Casimicrobium sp.]